MTRERALNVICEERQRQRRPAKISIVETTTPDSLTVIGIIDLYKIARACEEVSMVRK